MQGALRLQLNREANIRDDGAFGAQAFWHDESSRKSCMSSPVLQTARRTALIGAAAELGCFDTVETACLLTIWEDASGWRPETFEDGERPRGDERLAVDEAKGTTRHGDRWATTSTEERRMGRGAATPSPAPRAHLNSGGAVM